MVIRNTAISWWRLCVWIGSRKKFSLKVALKTWRWCWHRYGWRETVPDACSRNRKCTVADCLMMRPRHYQCRRGRRSEPSSGFDVRYSMELRREIRWGEIMLATVCENRETIIDPLWSAQPVEVTLQRSDVFLFFRWRIPNVQQHSWQIEVCRAADVVGQQVSCYRNPFVAVPAKRQATSIQNWRPIDEWCGYGEV